MRAAALCAWQVATNEWRIQSRIWELSRYLRSLKLTRCAWSICGDHLTIWRLDGNKQKATRVMRNANADLVEKSTERVPSDLPRSGVFIS